MRSRRLLIAAALVGCGGGGSAAAVDASPPEDASPTDAHANAPDGGSGDGATDAPVSPPCEAKTVLDGGVACGVAPSLTGAGISDAFQHHAIAIPAVVDAKTPFFVFLKGTNGVPFDPSTLQYPGSSLGILQEGVARGRTVMIIAYDAQPGLDAICGDDLACYGAVRREILEGIEAGDPGDAKHVRPPNDVLSRIAALVTYLHGLDPRVPSTLDWATTRLGGGSQGGGHAIYIAKELRKVQRACNLAGLGDSDAASVPASWIVSGMWMTPIDGMRGVIHAQDPWFSRTTTAWGNLGFQPDVHWRLLDAPSLNPHDFVVGADPTAVAARAWACFD